MHYILYRQLYDQFRTCIPSFFRLLYNHPCIFLVFYYNRSCIIMQTFPLSSIRQPALHMHTFSLSSISTLAYAYFLCIVHYSDHPCIWSSSLHLILQNKSCIYILSLYRVLNNQPCICNLSLHCQLNNQSCICIISIYRLLNNQSCICISLLHRILHHQPCM